MYANCVYIWIAGRSAPSEPCAWLETEPTEPGVPPQPMVHQVDAEKLELDIEPPSTDGGRPIIEYEQYATCSIENKRYATL